MTKEQQALPDKVACAPEAPGCYIFYDGMGNIIYVGKSRMLKNRVRSYFHASAASDERIAGLVREIRDVSYVVTDTELNALIEEYRLIKRHRPWFNAQHKRDTVQPYLRIPLGDPYPSISIAETKAPDGAAYFGAFGDVWDAQKAIALISDAWRTPRCGKRFAQEAAKPCLYHQMAQCTAPCARQEAQAVYRETIEEVARLLSGKPASIFARLEAAMRAHAAAMQFEKAAAIKETLEQLGRLQRKCRHRFRIDAGTHAAILLRGYGEDAVSVFVLREGRITGRGEIRSAGPAPAIEALSAQYANAAEPVPDSEWLIPCLMDIHADKQYVPLPKQGKAQTVCRRILQAYAQFTGKGA